MEKVKAFIVDKGQSQGRRYLTFICDTSQDAAAYTKFGLLKLNGTKVMNRTRTCDEALRTDRQRDKQTNIPIYTQTLFTVVKK